MWREAVIVATSARAQSDHDMVICVGAMRKTLKRWRSTLMVAVTLLGFTMCLLTGTGIYVEPSLQDGDYEYVHEDIQPVPKNWRGLSESQMKGLSGLGRRLFLGDESAPARTDSNFTILVWKHGPQLERRHIYQFGSQRHDPFVDCSVGNCRITYNSSELSTANAVLFHLHRTPGRSFLPSRHALPSQRWVFLTDENPYHTFTLAGSSTRMREFDGLFNWSMTYRMDSDVPVPSGRTVSLAEGDRVLQRKKKSKLAAIMVSNCGGKNKRWQYVQELRKHMKLDVYGSCGQFRSAEWRHLHQSAVTLTSSMTAVEGIGANLVFQGQEDRFNGITVDSSKEPCDVGTFMKKLQASLSYWKEKSFRGVWFRVALEHADWVPVLAKNKFQYHHAKPGYVTMYRWLPTDEECNIPPYAHTMVGVGAVVVNEANEVLVVKEKYFLIPHWKLPGGYVEPGEDIGDAAVREVFEETGVQAEFEFLISLRHTHHGMFRCSDIYFVVGLKPKSGDINKCNREIAACEWMKIGDFLEHPHVHETNRLFVRKYLEYVSERTNVECMKGIHPLLKKPQCVFSIAFPS